MAGLAIKPKESKAIELTRWLLTPLGVWSLIKKTPSTRDTLSAITLQFFCYSVILFALIPSIFHIAFREKNLNAKIALCGPVGFFMMNMLKYSAIIRHRKSIKKCIESVETDWERIDNDQEWNIMTKNLLIGRKLTIVCASFIYTGGMSYHTVMPFLMGSPASSEHFADERPLVFPGYDVLFDPFISPVYEIVYFSHCLAALIIYTITTVSCNIAASFVTHASGQIEIIVGKLNGLVGDGYEQDDKCLREKMGDIVRDHGRVIRFTVDIERVLRDVCLVEVFASTIIICLLEYYCLTTWNESETIGIITYFLLLVSLSFNIFIFCYIGEVLKEQCYEAGYSAYLIDWHRLPPPAASGLILIIANAQVPRKLTAGGMLELSLSSFLTVMKTSLVYLNLLRTAATS
ncbi:odorant receptor 82a isoform X1 [Diachasma alloeum]|uniref:Odorant receptor n=1 Tax=Diachasma alloeum TaxID=454923 RepID=A0A4E0RJW6_9HYME|nr:odorant receptor 82a isoform X1 [Diachasma alloeum]THK33042.1 odorant receptor 16 [Diachasma alloeum]